jgi:hypothetical protein
VAEPLLLADTRDLAAVELGVPAGAQRARDRALSAADKPDAWVQPVATHSLLRARGNDHRVRQPTCPRLLADTMIFRAGDEHRR